MAMEIKVRAEFGRVRCQGLEGRELTEKKKLEGREVIRVAIACLLG